MRLIAFLVLFSIVSSGICSAAHACAGLPTKSSGVAMSDECMKHMAGKSGQGGAEKKAAMDFCSASSCCHMWIGSNDVIFSVPVLYSIRELNTEQLFYTLPPDKQFRPPRGLA